MPLARLDTAPPGRSPTSRIPPAASQMNARSPFGPVLNPTIWRDSLMSVASLLVSPGSTRKSASRYDLGAKAQAFISRANATMPKYLPTISNRIAIPSPG